MAAKPSESGEYVTLRVYEKLRQSLCSICGNRSFLESLASRILTLAKPEAPALAPWQITADGSIRGLGESKPQIDNDRNQDDHDQANERGVVAHRSVTRAASYLSRRSLDVKPAAAFSGQVRCSTIPIRGTGEKCERTRKSEDKQTTH